MKSYLSNRQLSAMATDPTDEKKDESMLFTVYIPCLYFTKERLALFLSQPKFKKKGLMFAHEIHCITGTLSASGWFLDLKLNGNKKELEVDNSTGPQMPLEILPPEVAPGETYSASDPLVLSNFLLSPGTLESIFNYEGNIALLKPTTADLGSPQPPLNKHYLRWKLFVAKLEEVNTAGGKEIVILGETEIGDKGNPIPPYPGEIGN